MKLFSKLHYIVATILISLMINKVSIGQTLFFGSGVSTYTIPSGVTSIKVTAQGADGGSYFGSGIKAGGSGAILTANFTVTTGDVITLIVGSQGLQANGFPFFAGGGGGGTGIILTRSSTNYLLMVAGGGGGCNGYAFNGVSGGNNGKGGYAATNISAGGGAGDLFCSGGGGYLNQGLVSSDMISWISGGEAASLTTLSLGGSWIYSNAGNNIGAYGGSGFGGGGYGHPIGGGGGGGGYKGGNGSNVNGGDGGTSFINTLSPFNGSLVSSSNGVDGGATLSDGSVTIQLLPTQTPPIVTGFSPSTAVTGTSVIITGANFSSITSVKFGGTNASSFTVNSQNQITAVVGTGTSGSVAVTNVLGSGSKAGFTFGAAASSPYIKYAFGSIPQNFTIGSAITPLTIINTGGAVPSTNPFGYTTTFAGSNSGSADGIGTAASFSLPTGVSLDALGNLFVVDDGNNKIRKITSTGVVSTFAGSGLAGSTNGTGAAASFNQPGFLTIDASGNLFITEIGNHKIRKITSGAVVSTFAGSGSAGATNGTGTAASFNGPTGVVLDASNNLFVSDFFNYKIRKITSGAVVSTFAGSGSAGSANGTGSAASFNGVYGVAADASNNIYVTDLGNSKIRKITSAGVVSDFAGTGTPYITDGPKSNADFYQPKGIAINQTSGCIFITDYHLIRVITRSGFVYKVAGASDFSSGYVDGAADVAKFNSPFGLTTDASGNLYVADQDNNRIRKICITGYSISPTLPAGLIFDGKTGTISGTPTETTPPTTFTINAFNAGGVGTTTIIISTSNVVAPILNVSGTLNNFSTCKGTVSAAQSIKLSGTLLNGNAIITAPTGFEVSTSLNSGYFNSISIAPNSVNTILDTTVYIRVAASAPSSPSGNISFVSSGATTKTLAVTATLGVTGVWNGSVSNNFNTSGNWTGCPADTAINVTITNAGIAPIVSTAGFCKSMVINAGAKISVTGSLTAINGITVKPGGSLIGNSSNVTGTVAIQQNIIGQRGFRMFANPFSTNQVMSSVAATNAITINTSPQASGITDTRIYNSATNTWSNVTNDVMSNSPYALFIRGLASEVNGLTYTGGPSAFTYQVSGTLNGAAVSINPSNPAPNFTMVGNPYAAPVNSSALTNGAGKPYYIYQIAQGGTQILQRTKAGSWVAVPSSSSTTPIPALGVIAYQPATTVTYNITNSDINTINASASGLFRENSILQMLELQVEKDNQVQDKLFIRQDSYATDNGNDVIDLQKFMNENVNIYAIAANKTPLAVDARKEFSNNIPLGIWGEPGSYNLKIAVNSLPNNLMVKLKDNLLKTETDLVEYANYKFDITSDTATKGVNRFELIFVSKPIFPILSSTFTAKILGNITNIKTISILAENAREPINVRVVDLFGRVLIKQSAFNGVNKINLGAAKGLLIFQITCGNTTITEKIISN